MKSKGEKRVPDKERGCKVERHGVGTEVWAQRKQTGASTTRVRLAGAEVAARGWDFILCTLGNHLEASSEGDISYGLCLKRVILAAV